MCSSGDGAGCGETSVLSRTTTANREWSSGECADLEEKFTPSAAKTWTPSASSVLLLVVAACR